MTRNFFNYRDLRGIFYAPKTTKIGVQTESENKDPGTLGV